MTTDPFSMNYLGHAWFYEKRKAEDRAAAYKVQKLKTDTLTRKCSVCGQSYVIGTPHICRPK